MLQRALDRTRGWAGDVATLLGRSVGHSYEAFQGRDAPDERSPLLAHRGPVRVARPAWVLCARAGKHKRLCCLARTAAQCMAQAARRPWAHALGLGHLPTPTKDLKCCTLLAAVYG